MKNRMWNSKNPHQGNAERILCVCHAGLLRSPTIANVLAGRGFNTRSVGSDRDFALIPMDEVLLEWADTVIVVDFTLAQDIRDVWGFEGDIIHMPIPDEFDFMQPELVEWINNFLPQDRHKWVTF